MPDIADQLDAAIGVAPDEAPTLGATLDLGRRALRRRRLAYGVGAAATAVVIGGTAWAVSPGDDRPPRSDQPGFVGVPSTGTPGTSASPGPDSGDDAAPWFGADAARLDAPGRVAVKPGWSVSEDISSAGEWWAVEVTKGGRRQWFLFGGGTTIGSLRAPALGYDSFQEWVDVNAPLLDDPGPDGGPQVDDRPGVPRDDLVVFVPRSISSARGLAPASDDVVVVDQRFGVDLGASFAAPRDTGVAEVQEGGTTWYVVARRPGDYIAVRAAGARREYGVDDLDAFIDFARARYAEGGGGLL